MQSAVSTLRKALDDNSRAPSIVETIPKRGYRLIAPSSVARPVIAVLPIENLTGRDEQQHLADGLTDVLIGALGRHPELSVISRQSVVACRSKSLSLPEIAASLNATIVVEGSLLPGPGSVAATVQVIDAATDTHLWSDTYRVEPTRLFGQQQQIAARIAELSTSADSEASASEQTPAIDADAMRHYLLGRFHWNKLHPGHFPAALEHFEKAIAIEPRFSAAHAGIADVWGALGYWGALPATGVRDKIRESVGRALDSDPHGAEALMLAGAYCFHIEHDWLAARLKLEVAIERNPSLAHAHLLHGLVLGTIGDPRARHQFATAQRLDPLNPAVHMAAAMHAASDDSLASARRHLGQALELEPCFPPGLELSADLAWHTGAAGAMERERLLWQSDEAVCRILSDETLPDDRQRLETAACRLRSRAETGYVSPRTIARLFSLAGKPDQAVRVLTDAVDAQDLMQPDLVSMMPAFAPVRRNAQFAALRRRLGLNGQPAV